MSQVWIASAVRTPVANRDGALAHLQAWQLASPLINALVQSTGVEPDLIDHVLMGNALYAGGNPARLAALDANLPENIPAITLDSQCCAGMDSIALGSQIIRSGAADLLIAGGLESWSRAPQRTSNPMTGTAQAYDRPPFSPWPDRDPDMLEAAAALAEARGISRTSQEQYAIESHRKALAHQEKPEIFPLGGLSEDEYTRPLNERLCKRLPVVAGMGDFALNAATVASQADAAALVLLASEEGLKRVKRSERAIKIVATNAGGSDPAQPALAPIDVAQILLLNQRTPTQRLYSVHLMEAFAVQAQAFIEDLGLESQQCNPTGGALSRGHPIGASGVIEVVNAFHTLQSAPSKSRSLCAIAAAGGLGSAMLLERQ